MLFIYAKFLCRIKIYGWIKTTSGFRYKQPPYSNSISGFNFNLTVVIGIRVYIGFDSTRHFGLHQPRNFHSNRTIRRVVLTSCQFSAWRMSAMLDLLYVMMDRTRCRWRSELCLQIIVSYSFRDTAVLYFRAFAWNCLFAPIFAAVLRFEGIFPPNYIPYRPCSKTCCLSHKRRKSFQWFEFYMLVCMVLTSPD